MSTLNTKKNDWFEQFSGYIILAGIIAVVAGFGISRIFNSWGLSSILPVGIGGGVIIGLSAVTAVRKNWFSTEASKRKALVGTNVAIMSVFCCMHFLRLSDFSIIGIMNVLTSHLPASIPSHQKQKTYSKVLTNLLLSPPFSIRVRCFMSKFWIS